MNKKLAEIAGWYGMAAIVSAYCLVSFDILSSDGMVYQLLNLTGAITLIWISFKKGVSQVVALNTFWALIALLALGRIFLD